LPLLRHKFVTRQNQFYDVKKLPLCEHKRKISEDSILSAFDLFQNLMKIKARRSKPGPRCGVGRAKPVRPSFCAASKIPKVFYTQSNGNKQEMKQLVEFWALIGTIGHDNIVRATLASGLAIALVLAAGVPTAQAGDNPQECVAFDADLIDEQFLLWSDTTGFDPSINTTSCFDYHWSNPTTVFEARIDGITFFRVALTISEADPTKGFAYGQSWYAGDIDSWSNTDEDDILGWFILPKSRAHICRANILQSLTWQLYCPGNVNQ